MSTIVWARMLGAAADVYAKTPEEDRDAALAALCATARMYAERASEEEIVRGSESKLVAPEPPKERKPRGPRKKRESAEGAAPRVVESWSPEDENGQRRQLSIEERVSEDLAQERVAE